MGEIENTAGMVVGLLMVTIVGGVIISSASTDAILGATTSSVNPITTLVFVALSILGIGIVALVGKYIINIFN